MQTRRQGAAASGPWMGAAALLVAACAPGLAPLPTPAPGPPAPVAPTPTPVVPRVSLPARLGPTTWRVSSVARLTASGPGLPTEEQRVESRALVSWTLARGATGGVRGTGQVEAFTITSSLDSAATRSGVGGGPPMPAMLLVEATVDSAVARVSTRPPLANECDRPEASAAALARELLVRIPDGVAVGDRWRDSTATLVCRSGVPIVVYTTIRSTLDALTAERLLITRDITTAFDGTGGSPFRALELHGTGSGRQRVEVRASDGSLSRLDGSATLTLQLRETAPPAVPRRSQLVQKTEFRAERTGR